MAASHRSAASWRVEVIGKNPVAATQSETKTVGAEDIGIVVVGGAGWPEAAPPVAVLETKLTRCVLTCPSRINIAPPRPAPPPAPPVASPQ